MDCIRLTEKTLPWFLPILTEEAARALEEDPQTLAVGAVSEGTACGVLVCRFEEDLADLIYLAVSDVYRRRGAATAMLNALCRALWAEAVPVACTFSAGSEEDGLYRLFRDHPFFTVAEEEGFVCELPLEDLARPNRLTPYLGRVKNAAAYFDLPAVDRRRFRGGEHVPYLAELLDDPAIDRELSLCAGDGAGIAALLLFAREADGLELSLVWSAPGCQSTLIGLLAEAAGRIAARGDRGVLRIAAVTPESAAIVDKLFPQRAVTERFYQAVWDMELPGEEVGNDAP